MENETLIECEECETLCETSDYNLCDECYDKHEGCREHGDLCEDCLGMAIDNAMDYFG